jgi:hypothetical protein
VPEALGVLSVRGEPGTRFGGFGVTTCGCDDDGVWLTGGGITGIVAECSIWNWRTFSSFSSGVS